MRKIIFTSLLLLGIAFILNAQQMNVATYNLRNANKNDSINGNGWGQRCPVVADLIRFHDFDIFGTQEGKYDQLQQLKAALPGYDYTGVGRDDGKRAGEHSAIFYKTDKFELLKHGDFWLSTVTDRPNKGWDAALPRICSWGEFREKETGFTFLFFNLHMDHIGVKAREESSKLVLREIGEINKDLPVILTGDFNVDQNHACYAILNNSGTLKDSYEKAEFTYATNGTFNNFKTNLKTNSRIDHLFLSPVFKVKRYGILTDTYRVPVEGSKEGIKSGNFPKEVSLHQYEARVPSDHFPVMIVVDYGERLK